MSVYTYTQDMPHINVDLNKKAYYKLPRSILLPPYLAVNPYFVDYADAIDEVFDYLVEAKVDALKDIRNMWVTNKTTEKIIADGEMIAFTDWGGPERTMIVRQVNLLGMKLANAGVLDESAYRAVAKHLGVYWFGKGKGSAIDFMNFCLGAGLTITSMISPDYVTFAPAGSQNGNMIYDEPPGPWFPTTHVQIIMPLRYSVDPITLGSFFYEICNYNLVLQSIGSAFDYDIVTEDNPEAAEIIHIAALDNYQSFASTPYYPILYHSRVGGWTGGVKQTLMQISDAEWPWPV